MEASSMRWSLSKTFWALALALAFVTSALAQSLQDGNITGKVTDSSGARAPGVTVTLSSPVLITKRTTTTDSEGLYRFTALPPGTYALTFELPGAAKLTHTDVRVSLATTTSIDATLKVGGISENVEVVGTPLVDVTQANVATNLDDKALQEIPTARDVWAILQNMAPQVVLNREDVGGSQGGLQAVFSTHGSSWHQNTYAMNGVNVTDPAATGAAGFYYDYDSFEQVQISTAQHSAEVGTPGVYYNFVAKRGADTFHGGLAYYFENSGLVSDNVTPALKAQGVASGGGIHLFSDGTAQLGGPLIKDKLRFYTSWRDWRIHRNVPNFFAEGFTNSAGQPCVVKVGTSPCTPKTENTDLFSGLVNLTYEFNPKNHLDVLWTRQTYWKPNRNASAQIQPDSTWIEDDVFSIYQGRYTSSISSNALLDVRVSYSDVSFPLYLQSGVTQPNNIELTTGNQTGAAQFAYNPAQHRTRLALDGSYSWAKGNLAGADHQFKAGYEFYRGYASSNLDALQGINLQTFNGAPSTVTEYNTPVPDIAEFTGSVLFLQDNITKNRLAINLGLRYEHTKGFLPAQSKPAGPFSAAESIPRKDVISWNDLAPRVGLVYDILGNHKAAIKVGYGRYHHQISSGMIDSVNPLGLAGKGYNWVDHDGDGKFQPGEEGNLLFAFGGNINSVDPHLKRPRTDEVTAGLDWELPANIKFGVTGVFRWGRNLIALAEVGIPQNTTGYNLTTGIDPGPDGKVGTADDRPVTVYNLKPEYVGKNARLETNPSDFKSDFQGVEVTLQKRFSRSWQGMLAYAYSHDNLSSTSVTVAEYGGEEEGAGGIGYGSGANAFQDPNAKINNTSGPTFFRRTHSLKMSGNYEIPKIDVNLGAVFKVQSGTPYGRIVSLSNDANGVPFNQGPITFFGESRDAHTFSTIVYMDLRVGKFFKVGKNHRIEVDGDFFNVFNANTITNQNVNTGSAYNNATDILGPRAFRIGARWTF
jgi:hypothetical protein